MTKIVHGSPCRVGHTLRYASTRACVECLKLYKQKYFPRQDPTVSFANRSNAMKAKWKQPDFRATMLKRPPTKRTLQSYYPGVPEGKILLYQTLRKRKRLKKSEVLVMLK